MAHTIFYLLFLSGCTDSRTECPKWKGWGACETDPNYMRKYCKKSCNTCGNTEKNKSEYDVDVYFR